MFVRPILTIVTLKALLISGALSLWAFAEDSASVDVPTVMKRLNDRYQRIHSYSARFDQRFISSALVKNREKVWSGSVQFKKGRGFYWEYEKPEKKIIGSDNRLIWTIFPEDKEVRLAVLEKEQGFQAGLAYLWGEGKLEDYVECHSAEAEPEKKRVRLSCSQKSGGRAFKSLAITMSEADAMIQSIQLTDHLDNISELIFQNAQTQEVPTEKLVDPKKFKFVLPKGFRIVDGSELIVPKKASPTKAPIQPAPEIDREP